MKISYIKGGFKGSDHVLWKIREEAIKTVWRQPCHGGKLKRMTKAEMSRQSGGEKLDKHAEGSSEKPTLGDRVKKNQSTVRVSNYLNLNITIKENQLYSQYTNVSVSMSKEKTENENNPSLNVFLCTVHFSECMSKEMTEWKRFLLKWGCYFQSVNCQLQH